MENSFLGDLIFMINLGLETLRKISQSKNYYFVFSFGGREGVTAR